MSCDHLGQSTHRDGVRTAARLETLIFGALLDALQASGPLCTPICNSRPERPSPQQLALYIERQTKPRRAIDATRLTLAGIGAIMSEGYRVSSIHRNV
jgi:hypothetical protein